MLNGWQGWLAAAAGRLQAAAVPLLAPLNPEERIAASENESL